MDGIAAILDPKFITAADAAFLAPDDEVNGEIAAVVDARGRTVPHVFACGFAWQVFHPDTTVYP